MASYMPLCSSPSFPVVSFEGFLVGKAIRDRLVVSARSEVTRVNMHLLGLYVAAVFLAMIALAGRLALER